MSETENEILELTHILFQNLGIADAQLLDRSNLEVLYEDSLYIEIFKLMFPVLKTEFESIEEADNDPSEKIQLLIDYLASEVLKIDLNHIEGTEITVGNLKHVLHFVQLLAEVSNLCKLKSENDTENDYENDEEEEENEEDFKFDGYERPTKEGKINEDELMIPPTKEVNPAEDFKYYLEENDDLSEKNSNQDYEDEEEEEVSEIKEVSKSKEVSDRRKSKEKKTSDRTKKPKKSKGKHPKMNEIDDIYEKIKQDLDVPSNNDIQIFENDPIDYKLLNKHPSTNLTKGKGNKTNSKKNQNIKNKSSINTRSLLKDKNTIIKNIERNIFNAKTFQPRFITHHPPQKTPKKNPINELQKADNVSFLRSGPVKNESIKKSLGLQREAKQEVENIYEILCENIEKIKENLDGMRNYNLNDDDFDVFS